MRICSFADSLIRLFAYLLKKSKASTSEPDRPRTSHPHPFSSPHLPPSPPSTSPSDHRLYLGQRNPHILTELLKSHGLMLLFMEMLLYFLNQVTAVAFTFSRDDLDVFRINAQSCQLGFIALLQNSR